MIIDLGHDQRLLLDDQDAHLTAFPWRVHTEGYAVRTAWAGRSVNVYLHREILGLTAGDGAQVDHVNGDRLDNRRCNLRVVRNAENAQNTSSRSGYRGVHFDQARGKWMARVKLDYRHHFLGRYDDERDAARAAEAFRREHMPFSTPTTGLDPVGACPCRDCALVVA